MCSSAFTWRPWFYHNIILLPASVMSMYRQSGDENAGFRTEVSIKHRIHAESVTSTLIGRYSETTNLTDLTAGFPSDSARTCCWPLLEQFLWGFLLFWKEVKTLKIQDASWKWKFPECQEFQENWHLWSLNPTLYLCIPGHIPALQSASLHPSPTSLHPRLHPRLQFCIPGHILAFQTASLHPNLHPCIPACILACQSSSFHPNLHPCIPGCRCIQRYPWLHSFQSGDYTSLVASTFCPPCIPCNYDWDLQIPFHNLPLHPGNF